MGSIFLWRKGGDTKTRRNDGRSFSNFILRAGAISTVDSNFGWLEMMWFRKPSVPKE